MFRDTSEELARLEAELLAEEEPVEEVLEEQEEYWEEDFTEELDEEPEPPRYRVYNTDITDEDLDEYAEEVQNPRRSGCSTVLVIILCLLTLSIVALVALILRQGGFL